MSGLWPDELGEDIRESERERQKQCKRLDMRDQIQSIRKGLALDPFSAERERRDDRLASPPGKGKTTAIRTGSGGSG